MRLKLILPVFWAVFVLVACSEKHEESPTRTTIDDSIECDAKCEARRKVSGAGDFPSLDTKVTPRRNGNGRPSPPPAIAPKKNDSRKE